MNDTRAKDDDDVVVVDIGDHSETNKMQTTKSKSNRIKKMFSKR